MREIVRTLIIIFVVVLIWIGFSIYSTITQRKTGEIAISSSNLSNFNTNLYISNLSKLQSSEQYICVNQSLQIIL